MALDTNTLNSLRIERNTQTQPTKRKLPVKILLLIAVALFAMSGWFFISHKTIEVTTAEAVAVNSGGPNILLDASGYVVARRQATVSAKVTGKIDQVFIEEGMQVKAGQLLAQLDNSNVNKQLALAKHQVAATRSELKQIQIRLAEAQRTLQRLAQLQQNHLVSEADLDTARSSVAALKAQAEAAQNQIDVAQANENIQQQNVEDLLVRAPFTGVVISKDAQPGEIISPISSGGFTRSGIATIVDMDSREIEVDVNESFIHRVQDKQKTEAILDAYPDWAIPSHVISIVPAADRQKATVRVRISFDALDNRILPDMGVKVRFLDNAQQNKAQQAAIELPSSAVFSSNGKNYVWQLRDNRIHRIAVATGAIRNDRMEIRSGIQAGDQVVAQPSDKLKEGMRVKVHHEISRRT